MVTVKLSEVDFAENGHGQDVDDLQYSQLSEVSEEVEQEINLKIEPALFQIKSNTSEDPFISYMRRKHLLRRKKPHVTLDVKMLKNGQELEDFTFEYLQKLEENGSGSFSQRKENKGGNVQYKCERSRKPRGKEVRDPLKTRANACGAYVSFLLDAEADKKACIIRCHLLHSGHDPRDMEERRVSVIDCDLVLYINQLIDEGKKGLDILNKVMKWAAERKHTDFRDRRYYPTPNDIKYLVETRKAQTRLDRNDAVSVERLCRTEMHTKIRFYQPLHSGNYQPLIIVYQNEKQFERMKEFCKDVVFMDASYKGLTAYGYALYCLLARNEVGQGTPVAYFITSEDSEHVLATCLTKLKEYAQAFGEDFSPRSFMVDKDFKEINAIETVFPNSQVLLCWFHVLQATHRWMSKEGSGLTGKQNKDKRTSVLDYMRKLRSCTTIESFEVALDSMTDDLPNDQSAAYIRQQWVPIKEKWCLLGRRFYHGDHDTNNLVERFFLSMKYHFLRGFANRRVDDLLRLLDGDVASTFDYLEGLILAGRISNKAKKGINGKSQAETMISQGWSNIVIWHLDHVCYVPSQTSPSERGYIVDILQVTCECQSASQGGMCKHIHVAFFLAAANGFDADRERQQRALELYSANSYTVDYPYVSIFGGEVVGVVNLRNMRCICTAASHHIDCICKRTAKLIAEKNPDLLPTNLSMEQDVSSEGPCEDEVVQSSRDCFKKLLLDVNEWAGTTCNVPPAVLNQMKKLHTHIFGTFRHVYRHRKNKPLHPYRKAVEKAKKQLSDHGYPTVPGKKPRICGKTVREHGSFKQKKKKGRTSFLSRTDNDTPEN